MDVIINLLTSFASAASVTDTGLLMIVIALIALLYKYIIKPMYEKVLIVPTKDEVKDIVGESIAIEKTDFEELSKKLESVSKSIEFLKELDKSNFKEITEIKRDVEQIKQILNQFQGHMMYGGRRTSDFGNRELK